MTTVRPGVAAALYDTTPPRRDVRGEFTGDPIDDDVLDRVVRAAHAAPSVGLTQPWDFVVIRATTTRQRFRDHVMAERQTFAEALASDRARQFGDIQIDAIMEA